MHTSISKSLTVTAAIALLALSVPTFAQDGPAAITRGKAGGGHSQQQLQQMQQKREARREQLYQQLGITPEQSAKLKSVREANQAQIKALREQSMTKRKALSQYMSQPNADANKAMAMQKELAAINQKMEEQRLKGWFEMRKNLTPEQVTKLQEMRQQHANQRGQGNKMGKRPGANSGGPNGGIIPPGSTQGQ